MAEHDATRVFNLIIKELAKVLHIHLALRSVYDRRKSVESSVMLLCTLCRLDNVRKLSYARGLDENTVGLIFVDNVCKRLREIAHKRATDASRIHFVDLYSRLLQKSAIDTDSTEFIFNKNDSFTLVCFLDKLLYKRGLSCAEEARENINLCHISMSFQFYPYFVHGKRNSIYPREQRRR